MIKDSRTPLSSLTSLTSRRSMLRALGLGGLAAAVLPYTLREMRSAVAGPSTAPTRVLFVYGMGSMWDFYSPTGPSGGAPSETSWALGSLHGPLKGHESKLIVLDGLDMAVQNVKQVDARNSHVKGGTHALTAAKRQSDALAAGPSIDQWIAQSINKPTPLTAVPSLELSSGADGGDSEGGPHYLSAGTPTSPEQNPNAAFKRVFASFAAPDDSAAKAALAQKKSVLDAAAGEFDKVTPKLALAKEDRVKLEAHAAAIRDLESRLALHASSACVPPDAKYKMDLAAWKLPGRNALADFDLDARLVTAAFSCDLTRVATVHLPTHYDLESTVGYSGGMFGTSDSHDLTHKTNNKDAALWGDAGAMAMVKKIHVTQSQMFASLLDHLDGIPEPDGGTLLDSTVVLWCGQIAEGGHALERLPWMLAGGGNGYFKMGRYLAYDRPGGVGLAHNDLFVSIANAMGISTSTFGEPSVCKGPLPRLRG